MPLLTELGNVLGCNFYKDVTPERGLVGCWPAARPHAAAAGVIFSGQNLCRAQSQFCETSKSTRSSPPQAGRILKIMFESFKSTKTLEKELREWLFNDVIKDLGEAGREEARTIAYFIDERELVTKVMGRSLSLDGENECNVKLAGKVASVSEILRWTKGNKLAHAFAKAKGWEIECEGSQAFGYTCYIK